MAGHLQSRWRRRWSITLFALAELTVTPALVCALGEGDDELSPAVLERLRGMGRHMDEGGWERERPNLENAITNMWQRNGWVDEADLFARDTACEIARIPPWQPLKRIRRVNERLERRYGLTGEEAVRLRAAVMREATAFLMRHTGVILEQTSEGLQTRAKSEPFTAEQVAEWVKESEPLFADLRRAVDRIVRELEPTLDPGRRRILQQDLKHFEKRQRLMDVMATRWAEGKWQPADWGLQNDPIQNARSPVRPAHPPRSATGSPRWERSARASTIGRWLSHDPSTWHYYLSDFQKRFDLDAGQVSTGESIHAELRMRADRYIEARTNLLKDISLTERMTHEAYEPVRSLFEEFKGRLDSIPTSSQRDRGKD